MENPNPGCCAQSKQKVSLARGFPFRVPILTTNVNNITIIASHHRRDIHTHLSHLMILYLLQLAQQFSLTNTARDARLEKGVAGSICLCSFCSYRLIQYGAIGCSESYIMAQSIIIQAPAIGQGDSAAMDA